MYQNEGENNLQEAYDSLLEDCGNYTKVANLAVKKMKKFEEEHIYILEIIQANVKVERISTKKLNNVLSSKKSSHDKTGLGYTEEGSSCSEPKKEVRFVSTKNHWCKTKGKREVITQKSKGTSSEASMSSLWRTRAHMAKLFQASCIQEG